MRILVWVWWVVLLGGCQTLAPPPTVLPPAVLESRRFHLPTNTNLIGQIARLRLRPGDTLADVARHFDIGLQAIQDANPGIDPWLPPPGVEIILPLAFILPDTPQEGIVVNLAAMRLFYFPAETPSQIRSHPVGIGRIGWSTPLGRTRIVQKKIHPSWVVPTSIRREHARKGDPLPRVVPPGPDNPLGQYTLRLGWPGYLIHGTNKPYGVGLRVSHGCLRLYPEDIAALFPSVPVGTPVTVVDQPYLVGWRNGQLFIQIHTPLRQDAKTLQQLWQSLENKLRRLAAHLGQAIDWQKVDRAIAEARGIPLPVLQSSPDWNTYLAQAPLAAHPQTWAQAFRPPLLRPGWYLAVDVRLTETEARKLVAILHHQGSPLPAYRIGNRVIIGPYPQQAHARRAKARLARELALATHIVPPAYSRRIIATSAADQRSRNALP